MRRATRPRPAPRAFTAAALALLLSAAASAPARAQDAPDPKLEKAVAALRRINVGALSEEQQEAKAREIDEAWKALQAAGPPGLARLKRELRLLGESKEQDDFFKLNASVLLWELGRFGEAEAVAEIWRTTPLKVSYNYPFYTAIDAARTQDERALPLLLAILADREGHTFFARHAMQVRWPLTHEFVWGIFGPKGLPALQRVAETSRDAAELASAVRLLARAQYAPALPRVRELATKGEGEAKLAAVAALGIYGHPQDYELLVAGLKSADPMEVWHHAFALYEFEDLRAVPHVIPLLESPHDMVRYEALSVLRHLLTPAALEAIHARSGALKEGPEKARFNRVLELLLGNAKTTWEEYSRKSPREKEAFVLARRRWLEDEAEGPRPKAWTRAEFLAAAARWKEKGRLEDEAGESVMPGRILAAATVEDIELLLDVKSRIYRRLSDEALYETARIDRAVKTLGRGRYRRETGVTEKAEAK